MSETNNTTPELLPCPFCGGKAAYFKLGGCVYGLRHHINCVDTTCFIGPLVRATSKEDAIFRWNRRA